MIDDDPRFEDELRAALRGAPPAATPCPEDRALAGFQAGTAAPEEMEVIREHLAACPVCVARSRDASAFVQAMRPPLRRAAVPAWALAAAAVVAGVTLLFAWRGLAPRAPEAPAIVVQTDRERWQRLEIEKAPFRPDSAGGLLWRGGTETDTGAVEGTLGWAMEPYAADDFAEAAARLQRRLQAEPDDDRARFYLGVAYLLDGKPAAALPSLREAAGTGGEVSEDAAWYLALAYLKSGDAAAARPLLARLAAGPGPRAELAKRRLAEIEGPTQ